MLTVRSSSAVSLLKIIRSDFWRSTQTMWMVIFNVVGIAFVVAVFYRPVKWGVDLAASWFGELFYRPRPSGVPCPKCGYDCRGFDCRKAMHRCPECGTELRWGQLP